MKTPEELAAEYLERDEIACPAINHAAEDLVKAAFIDGYKAAEKHYTNNNKPETLAEIGSSFARRKAEKFYQGFIRGKRR